MGWTAPKLSFSDGAWRVVSMRWIFTHKTFIPLINAQAFKHVFTSPSSAMSDDSCPASSKCTKSSNARIHGMSHVTVASIAYIATQVSNTLGGHDHEHITPSSRTGSVCAELGGNVFSK